MGFKPESAIIWLGGEKDPSGLVQIATIQRGDALEHELRRVGLKARKDYSSATFFTSNDSDAHPIVLKLEGNRHLNTKERDAIATATEKRTGEKILLRTTYVSDNPNIPEPPHSQRVAVMNFGVAAHTGPDIN